MTSRNGPFKADNADRDNKILDLWAQHVSTVDICAQIDGLKQAVVTNVVCAARAAGDPRAIRRVVKQQRLAARLAPELVALILDLWDGGRKTSAICDAARAKGFQDVTGRMVADTLEAARRAGDRRAHVRSGGGGGYRLAPPMPGLTAPIAGIFSEPQALSIPLLCPDMGIEAVSHEVMTFGDDAGRGGRRVTISLPRLRFMEA